MIKKKKKNWSQSYSVAHICLKESLGKDIKENVVVTLPYLFNFLFLPISLFCLGRCLVNETLQLWRGFENGQLNICLQIVQGSGGVSSERGTQLTQNGWKGLFSNADKKLWSLK